MAATHIALLRGINVGGAKRIAMADLRALMAKLGYTDVQTLLASGNVVFAGKAALLRKADTHISAAIKSDLGVSCRVTVVSATDLHSVVAENPLLDVATDPSRLLVAFPATSADLAKLQPLTRQDWGTEVLALGGHAAYLWMPEGVIDSAVAKAMAKVLGDGVTSRNWATVLKLQALVRIP